MSTLSISIARPVGGAYVVTNTPTAGRWLPEDGLSTPAFEAVYTRGPESAFVDGDTLLAVRRAASTLPFTVYLQAASASALTAMKAELAAALWQWPCAITVAVAGQSVTYQGWPSVPQWGPVDSGMVAAHIARASCVVPVNPA